MKRISTWTIFIISAAGLILAPIGAVASNSSDEREVFQTSIHDAVGSELAATGGDPARGIAITRAALNAQGYFLTIEAMPGLNTWDLLAENQKTDSKPPNQKRSQTSTDEDQAVIVSSGEEAINIVKQQEDVGEGIRLDDLGGVLREDEQGAYYTVQLTSKALSEAGGTGTVDRFKVYQNGDYISVYGTEEETTNDRE
ncbi:hypothetical protein CHL76_14115 [Marinococcus halophilus]|uniref:Uncharacterized protein n=1 Tax=Marinococcus halophilus TaxID=1371 RepID=A0A510YBV3_MARHA|nr:hypothetical protein [Marinococcus halophilus]OZT79175.1 hypothetical protein CHL76_14115 [Marinococcus halophilus]GEK59837.1 hypothetical protein MHA01_27420 [Marinococcus halophilus]